MKITAFIFVFLCLIGVGIHTPVTYAINPAVQQKNDASASGEPHMLDGVQRERLIRRLEAASKRLSTISEKIASKSDTLKVSKTTNSSIVKMSSQTKELNETMKSLENFQGADFHIQAKDIYDKLVQLLSLQKTVLTDLKKLITPTPKK